MLHRDNRKSWMQYQLGLIDRHLLSVMWINTPNTSDCFDIFPSLAAIFLFKWNSWVVMLVTRVRLYFCSLQLCFRCCFFPFILLLVRICVCWLPLLLLVLSKYLKHFFLFSHSPVFFRCVYMLFAFVRNWHNICIIKFHSAPNFNKIFELNVIWWLGKIKLQMLHVPYVFVFVAVFHLWPSLMCTFSSNQIQCSVKKNFFDKKKN